MCFRDAWSLDGLTGEEQSLKYILVVKCFETEPLSDNEKLKQKHKLERSEELKQIQGMALFQGGDLMSHEMET